MQVWGDTGTEGSKILGFQIPGTSGYIFSNLLLLGNENLKMSKCGGRSCLRSFPWLAVCCYLTCHKQCKQQKFSAARVPMDTCGMWYIGFGNVVCSCNFVICIVKYTHLCIRHGVQTSNKVRDSGVDSENRS
jgi:hypothetical protein